jgi:peptide/nickel transport system ATP-binding protein
VVSGLADDIAVMYAGRIVEAGPVADVLQHPRHRYTEGLIGSVPSSNRRGRRLAQIPGVSPTLFAVPSGCPFRTRCSHADALCATEPPVSLEGARMHRCVHPVAEAVA